MVESLGVSGTRFSYNENALLTLLKHMFTPASMMSQYNYNCTICDNFEDCVMQE